MMEVEAMACPVCTLYLREGMSMQSHLNTHPKDQVIEALVRLYTSGGERGNIGAGLLGAAAGAYASLVSPPPPPGHHQQQQALSPGSTAPPAPGSPNSPFIQVVTDDQIIMGRSPVSANSMIHPQVLSYPIWTEAPQTELKQNEYSDEGFLEDKQKKEELNNGPEVDSDVPEPTDHTIVALTDSIEGGSGVQDIGTMIRDAAGVIMDDGNDDDEEEVSTELLSRTEVFIMSSGMGSPGAGESEERSSPQEHSSHQVMNVAPVSPSTSNHSVITVRTDLTNPDHMAALSGAATADAAAAAAAAHLQYINSDCDYQDEDARDGDIINMDRDPISIEDLEDDLAREKDEMGEGGCSELNIQADERMPARGELSGQGSLGNTVESVWLPQEETPIVPPAAWEERESKAVKRTYRCLYCEEGFSCPKERRVHIASLHSNTTSDTKKEMKTIECTKCGIVMDTLKQLKEHTRTLHKRASRMCTVCSETFPTKGSYIDHLIKVHPLECSVCGKTFHSKPGLALHTKIHLPVKPHPCHLCEKSFVTAQKLREHINTHTGYAPLQCNMCDRKFKRYSNLKQHKDIFHFNVKKKTKEFFCECGESFASKKKLAWHQETHLEKPKQCAYCSERYVHGSSLTRHIRRAHDSHYLPQGQKQKAKNVQCPVCNLVFLESSLRAHMRRHSSGKQYGCIMCGKKFHTKWNLHLHRWTHASRHAKPHKCNQCKAAFIRLTDFQAHVRSHFGQKPFTCNHCGMQFNRKNNWQRHEKEHTATKNYTCDTCGKTFHRSYYLVEHTRVHSGDKPYSCHICNKSSATKSNHNKHLRTHHARETVNTEG